MSVDPKQKPGERWIKVLPLTRNSASNVQMVRLGIAHGDHPGGCSCTEVVARNRESSVVNAGRRWSGTWAAVSRMPQLWFANCAITEWEATVAQGAAIADVASDCGNRFAMGEVLENFHVRMCMLKNQNK